MQPDYNANHRGWQQLVIYKIQQSQSGNLQVKSKPFQLQVSNNATIPYLLTRRRHATVSRFCDSPESLRKSFEDFEAVCLTRAVQRWKWKGTRVLLVSRSQSIDDGIPTCHLYYVSVGGRNPII